VRLKVGEVGVNFISHLQILEGYLLADLLV
jgi:hypothetical protein